MRKPHPSAVLKNLPDEDQAALFEFLRSTGPDGKGKSLADGVKWLFSNNGVRTNDSSLSDWRGWYAMRLQIAGWNDDVEELKKLLSTDQKIDPNLIPKIGEAVFISRAAKEGDAKAFAAVASVIQRHKELESQQQAHADKMQIAEKKLDLANREMERKLEELRMKVAEFERKENETRADLGNTSLTVEQRAARMMERFGVKPS